MLMPKRVKYRRVHRGRMTGKALRGNSISYGDYAIQALEPCWMTANQIESARRAMTRYIKRGGKIWIKVFPDKPVTKKPVEMSGVPVDVAREAMRLAAHKLPVKTKFITREMKEGEANEN